MNKKTHNWVKNFIYLKFILKKDLFETMEFQKYLFIINISWLFFTIFTYLFKENESFNK